MKLTFTLLLASFGCASLFAQGFGTAPTTWPVPQGGHTYATIYYGYDDFYNQEGSGSPIGDHSWSVIDINGDNRPDLVITAQSKEAGNFANQPTAFGTPGNFYWKVHLNNGNGFASSPVNWTLPQGGKTYQTIIYGFDAIADSADSQLGDQSWSLIDMNNDNKPDLVVTAQRREIPGFANQATVFGTATSSHWKVYLNTGTGFNTSPITWTLPQGGKISSNIFYGFDALGGSAGATLGDQSWSVIDMNNDNRPDLVVTAQTKEFATVANQATVFGTPTNSSWKVYLNNGTGFSTTPITWTLPQGGKISSQVYYGFNLLGGSGGNTIGDQSWSVIDLNNDNRPDLVVTAQTKEFATVSNQAVAFGTSANSYWKVYLNNGNGFNTTATNWTLPQGGHTYREVYYGFDALADTADSQVGDQTWSVLDMNADNRPDLVVLAQRREFEQFSSQATVFGTPANSYWKVYLNNGSGFNLTPNNWTLPQGGHSYSSIYYGYDALSDDASVDATTGNQTWNVVDMNNDRKPDLVVTAASVEHPQYANHATVFGLPSTPYWKVYFNNSSLSVDDFAGSTERLKVFPNPSNSQFTVQTDDNSEIMSIGVYDLAGRKMLQQDATTTVDLSNFPKGMYLLYIKVGDEMITKKVILK